MADDLQHIDPTDYLEKWLPQTFPDLLRQMLDDFNYQPLSAQTVSGGAEYGTATDSKDLPA